MLPVTECHGPHVPRSPMIAITDALGSSLVVYAVFLERPRRTLQAREGEPGWVRGKSFGGSTSVFYGKRDFAI